MIGLFDPPQRIIQVDVFSIQFLGTVQYFGFQVPVVFLQILGCLLQITV